MRVSGQDRQDIWELYESHVVTDEIVLTEFLGKIKSPFGTSGEPAANTPEPPDLIVLRYHSIFEFYQNTSNLRS